MLIVWLIDSEWKEPFDESVVFLLGFFGPELKELLLLDWNWSLISSVAFVSSGLSFELLDSDSLLSGLDLFHQKENKSEHRCQSS